MSTDQSQYAERARDTAELRAKVARELDELADRPSKVVASAKHGVRTGVGWAIAIAGAVLVVLAVRAVHRSRA